MLSAAFGIGVVGLYALGLRALVTGEADADAGRGRRIARLGVLRPVRRRSLLFGIWVLLDK